MKKTAFIFLLFLAGCHSYLDTPSITSINIIDRNGLSETISSKDRIASFEKTDFLAPQPYQKVMRIYARDPNGQIHSQITSYHPNGEVKQYLEIVNNRAHGTYKEWYPNGHMKIEAFVIGGVADLNSVAEESWLFDGINKVWDEEEHLIASLAYKKGTLEGPSFYYYPSGALWKESFFENNLEKGIQKTYFEDGNLLQTSEYQSGKKHGTTRRYWNPLHIAFEEMYEMDRLNEATYYSPTGESVATIKGGDGFRAIVGKETIQELQEYKGGTQEGIVKVFDEKSRLLSTYFVKNHCKEGEESHFFLGHSQPKFSCQWKGGMLQGTIKTWYENGTLESQREMSENKKNGLLTAWYKNGQLMLVEEYENDLLVKGKYYKMDERTPISKIEKGTGIATLFDKEGNLAHKIAYQEGKPHE